MVQPEYQTHTIITPPLRHKSSQFYWGRTFVVTVDSAVEHFIGHLYPHNSYE